MPMRGELPTAAARSSFAQESKTPSAWSKVVAVLSDQDLRCIAMFSAIGLLAAINLALRIPDFGALSATLQAFP
jgi:hypothetical protein